MPTEPTKKKEGIIVVYTGDSKGKTSAGLGLMARALGSDFKVAFIQFIKSWDVGEHRFIQKILPVFGDKLYFYKGGLGFYNAGGLSSAASENDHKIEAKRTYDIAYEKAVSGDYQLVICDEINNAVHDGLLSKKYLEKIINDKHPITNLCLTGRNFPDDLIDKVDIVTNMSKIKHHFDNGFVANRGIDY